MNAPENFDTVVLGGAQPANWRLQIEGSMGKLAHKVAVVRIGYGSCSLRQIVTRYSDAQTALCGPTAPGRAQTSTDRRHLRHRKPANTFASVT